MHLHTISNDALYSVGMDYNHGTGHGVGAYLAVHEGPVGVGRDNSVLQVGFVSGSAILGHETQLFEMHFRSQSC